MTCSLGGGAEADRGIIFITHGEADAIEVLRRELQALGTSARIVAREIGERYEMTPGNPAKRIETGRTDLHDAVGGDWQNDYARFAVNLKRELKAIETNAPAARRSNACARC